MRLDRQVFSDVELFQMRVYIGFYDIQNIQSDGDYKRQISVASKLALCTLQSALVKNYSLKLIVIESGQTSFERIAVAVVIIVVRKIEVQTRAQSSIDNRYFPISFVVRLPQSRQYCGIKSGAGGRVGIDVFKVKRQCVLNCIFLF